MVLVEEVVAQELVDREEVALADALDQGGQEEVVGVYVQLEVQEGVVQELPQGAVEEQGTCGWVEPSLLESLHPLVSVVVLELALVLVQVLVQVVEGMDCYEAGKPKQELVVQVGVGVRQVALEMLLSPQGWESPQDPPPSVVA